jgi:hypothetical protein
MSDIRANKNDRPAPDPGSVRAKAAIAETMSASSGMSQRLSLSMPFTTPAETTTTPAINIDACQTIGWTGWAMNDSKKAP